MLLLCVTGLPLIFHDEIDDLLHEEVKPAAVPDGTPQASLDLAIANVLAKFPGQVVHFFVWNRDDPNAFSLSINRSFVWDEPADAEVAEGLRQMMSATVLAGEGDVHVDGLVRVQGQLPAGLG